jgi:RNA polymerase sigma-70 factor (ECF subfamily)
MHDDLTARLAADLDRAFPDLVRLVQDGVYAGALRMTGSRADAEDVTQEALARAYRALRDYPPERIRALNPRGWVWTIAANLCRNRARARARRPETALPDGADAIAAAGAGTEEQAVGSVVRARLACHLAMLPWPMRAAVVLRHVVGLGYPEIADALDRPAGTVKADVHRGLGRLRAAIEREEHQT